MKFKEFLNIKNETQELDENAQQKLDLIKEINSKLTDAEIGQLKRIVQLLSKVEE